MCLPKLLSQDKLHKFTLTQHNWSVNKQFNFCESFYLLGWLLVCLRLSLASPQTATLMPLHEKVSRKTYTKVYSSGKTNLSNITALFVSIWGTLTYMRKTRYLLQWQCSFPASTLYMTENCHFSFFNIHSFQYIIYLVPFCSLPPSPLLMNNYQSYQQCYLIERRKTNNQLIVLVNLSLLAKKYCLTVNMMIHLVA